MEYEIGKTYIIDEGFANSGEVILLLFGKFFCKVQCPETLATWETSLYRLTDI